MQSLRHQPVLYNMLVEGPKPLASRLHLGRISAGSPIESPVPEAGPTRCGSRGEVTSRGRGGKGIKGFGCGNDGEAAARTASSIAR
mgnify:CR=1 FL=1